MSKIYLLQKPPTAELEKIAAEQKTLPFSYQKIGATAHPQPVENFNNDHQKLPVGKGNADFQLAKKALQNWVHFPNHWTKIEPATASTTTGSEVVLLFNLFGTWWTSGCRVVYETNEAKKYGFAYGTLTNHIERGEELFQVEMDSEGTVWYEIRAFSQPRHWLVRLVKPLARLLQEKFRRDSLDAVRRFVASGGATTGKIFWRPDTWLVALAAAVVLVGCSFPGTFFHHDYGKPILIFAALLSSPFVLHLLAFYGFLSEKSEKILPLIFPAGLLLAAAQFFENQFLSAAMTLPWLFLAIIFSKNELLELPRKLTSRVATIFWTVGAAWAFADRAGIRPFDFSDEITRLTALHFHFAGLALPVLAGLAQHFSPSVFGKINVWMVLLGVPLTALGITATQLAWGVELEIFAGVFMSAAGLLTALRMVGLATRSINFWLLAAGVVLFFTMLLSAGYALRPVFPLDFLNINWMRAVHGSLNALVAVPMGLWGFLNFEKFSAK